MENNYEPGFYLTQSGYLVVNRKNVNPDEYCQWLYCDKYMNFHPCTFKDIVDLYGEDEFPLHKIHDLKLENPVKYHEPKDDGFYITKSGTVVMRTSKPLKYTWTCFFDNGPEYTDNFDVLVRFLGEPELPLRRITKDGLETVD